MEYLLKSSGQSLGLDGSSFKFLTYADRISIVDTKFKVSHFYMKQQS